MELLYFILNYIVMLVAVTNDPVCLTAHHQANKSGGIQDKCFTVQHNSGVML